MLFGHYVKGLIMEDKFKILAIAGVHTGSSPEEDGYRAELLERMNAKATRNVTSWESLYNAVEHEVCVYLEGPRQEKAEAAMATAMSFVQALRRMPEETDALVIAKEMNHIVLYHPELTGFTVVVGKRAEKFANEKDSLTQVMEAALTQVVAAAEVEELVNSGGHLH